MWEPTQTSTNLLMFKPHIHPKLQANKMKQNRKKDHRPSQTTEHYNHPNRDKFSG